MQIASNLSTNTSSADLNVCILFLTSEDIVNKIKSLNKGKSSGPDDVPPYLINCMN